MNKQVAEAIRGHIQVPPYIHALAAACRYDLLHGPAWARKLGDWSQFTEDDFASFPEDLEGEAVEVWGKPRAIFTDWLSWNVTSDLWVDVDCGDVMDREPEGYWDTEDGCAPEDDDMREEAWIEPSWESIYHVSPREQIEALFGSTIAKEMVR